MTYVLEKSPRSEKKWRITTPTGKRVDFGATGYEDYTIHMDPTRKDNYIARHQARENWTKSGIDTAGFWSRWLLWNLPDLNQSIKDIEKQFGITISYNISHNSSKNKDKEDRCIKNPDAEECDDEDMWYRILTERFGKYYNHRLNKPTNSSWRDYYKSLIRDKI